MDFIAIPHTAEKYLPYFDSSRLDEIPGQLRALDQWIYWSAGPVKPDGKFDKFPKGADGTGTGWPKSAQWMPFSAAFEAAGRKRGAGVGLVLPAKIGNAWLVALDFDRVDFNDPARMAYLQRLWEELGKPYTEISPSGKGLRMFVLSDVPLPQVSRSNAAGEVVDELFCSSPKWVTITANVYWAGGLPNATERLQPLVVEWGGKVSPVAAAIVAKASNKLIGDTQATQYAKLTETSLAKVLAVIDPSPEDDWATVANALARAYGEAGREWFHKFSSGDLAGQPCSKYDRMESDARYDRALAESAGRDGYGVRKLCELASFALTEVEFEGDSKGQEPLSADEWPEPKPMEPVLPKAQPFDCATLLPPILRAYVEDCAELMQAPADFIAAPLIVCLAAVVGNRGTIAPKANDTSWLVVPVLWGASVGRAGSMKSPTMGNALRMLRPIETKLEAQHQNKLAGFRAQKLAHAVLVKQAQSAILKGQTVTTLPPDPEEPQPERLIVNDVTWQKLADIAAHSPRGVLQTRDEIVAMLESLGSDGQEGARGFMLEAWNGNSSYRVDRVGRGSITVPRLAVWLYGGIQPGRLQPYVQQATKGGTGDDGLLQRFQLIVWPDTSPDWRNVDRPANLQACNDVEVLAQRLHGLDLAAQGFRLSPSGEGVHYQHFDPAAQALFDRWRAKLEVSLRGGNLHPALESHYAKYRSLIPALALLFHLIDGRYGPVGYDSLAMAIRWGEYLRSHAKKVYASATNPAMFGAKALADRIKSRKVNSPFTQREVYRQGWQYLSAPDDVTKALQFLEDAGWIRAIASTAHEGRGRPSPTYEINPKVWQ